MNGDGFEIDRGVGGRVKINVVSVANLIALIGLIGVAVSTWTALSSRVDTMGVRVEVASTSINDLKQSLTAQAVSRDTSVQNLQISMGDLKTRLAVVESVLNRLDKKLNEPVLQKQP